MPEQKEPIRPDVRVTVDGGEFYAFVRAMKRSYRASDLGDVVLSVRDCKLVIETARGGSVLACGFALPITARIHGGNFLRLVHLASDAKTAGPLTIVFRPEVGEVGLPHSGTKAKFD